MNLTNGRFWPNERRRLPEPELETIAEGVAWLLKIDTLGGPPRTPEPEQQQNAGKGSRFRRWLRRKPKHKAKPKVYSSWREEAETLWMSGWGSHLYHDYYVLGTKRALEYIKAHNLRLDRDLSTVAGIEMLVYKPDDPNKPATHHRHPLSVPHRSQGYGEPCFYCGKPRDQWVDDEECPAFLEVMGVTKELCDYL